MKDYCFDDELRQLNQRFIALVKCSGDEDLSEMAVRLNASVPFLRFLRHLTFDQAQLLLQGSRSLVMPAVSESALRHAVTIEQPLDREIYIGSATAIPDARVSH